MVKPGGTGNPMRHISARLAPLPPSSGFIVPLPSVFVPKRYTYLPDFAAADDVFRASFLATFTTLLSCLALGAAATRRSPPAPRLGDLHFARASSLAPFRSL